MKQCLADNARMDTSCSALTIIVNVIGAERLNIAIENQTDQFEIFINHWTAGIASNNVSGTHEVVRCRTCDLSASFVPTFRQSKILLALVRLFVLKRAVHSRPGRNRFALFLVTFDRTKRQSQTKSRVWIG